MASMGGTPTRGGSVEATPELNAELKRKAADEAAAAEGVGAGGAPDYSGIKALGKNANLGGSQDRAKFPGGLQQDINQILEPYMKELMSIGPEYSAEMQYLAPYLSPTHQTFSGLQAQSKANESPEGDKGVLAAEAASGAQLANQPDPFTGIVQAGKQTEQSIPYSQIIQDVLAAGKNQILGYSTVPNLTNINTQGWSDAYKGVVPYLEKSIGYTGAGVPNPTTAGIQAGTQPGGYNPTSQGGATPPTNPSLTPSLTGGGNG